MFIFFRFRVVLGREQIIGDLNVKNKTRNLSEGDITPGTHSFAVSNSAQH